MKQSASVPPASAKNLDKAPIAYKSIDDIIGETVDIMGILRPVRNFKAN